MNNERFNIWAEKMDEISPTPRLRHMSPENAAYQAWMAQEDYYMGYINKLQQEVYQLIFERENTKRKRDEIYG